jgi:hypothetical protein
VADRVDPLGKRALFWVPVDGERVDDPPPPVARPAAPRVPRPAGAVLPLAQRPARTRRELTGKRALFSPPEPAPAHDGAAPVGQRRAGPGLGAVQLRCATCGRWSAVSVLQFARLHLPFFLWRPGPGFARFMTCPACRRRAWISASWPAPATSAVTPGGRSPVPPPG